jgi:light-regulated signal transduction histidine kinase (bacteriophytochrome)
MAAVESIKAMTQYDRVMVYKFARDWHGEVVAEAKDEALEPYLGLHYPASDIPVQARTLYKRNLLRLIADVSYIPVKVTPPHRSEVGGVLDMSDCVLRSVSPVHLEYLQNMGVKATLTISVVVDGELWGLIACHHYTAKYLPLKIRSACALFGQLIALRVSGYNEAEKYKAQANTAKLFDAMFELSLNQNLETIKIVELCSNKLLEMFSSRGMVALLDDEVFCQGDVPPIPHVRRIAQLLDVSRKHSVFTDNMIEMFPDDTPPGFGGLLGIRVSLLRNDWIFCFRSEQTMLVNWAGDPKKSVEVSADGQRLHPRNSFAVWSEEVKGKSFPWNGRDMFAAETLREKFVFLRQESLDRERLVTDALEQQRIDLLSSLTHDLKNPILGSMRVLELIRKGRLGEGISEFGKHLDQVIFVQRQLYNRVSSLLLVDRYVEAAEDFFFDTISLESVVQRAIDVCEPYATSEKVKIIGKLAENLSLKGDGEALGRVIENLVNNAVKYSQPGSSVHVSLECSDSQALVTVSDNGVGIPAGEVDKIFKKYWQGENGRKFPNGSGLGLYASRQIVEAHRGKIWCQPGVDKGARFCVSLPLE